MSNESLLRRCPLYLPGHNVHFIQFRLTWNEPQHDPIPANLLEVRDDGELMLEVDGEVRRYWNHGPDDVARAMTRYNGEFELVGYGVLKVARRFHRVGHGMPVLPRPTQSTGAPVPARTTRFRRTRSSAW